MANAGVRGLVPTGHLHGRTSFQMKMRRTRGQNAAALMAGDIVRAVSGGVDIICSNASGGDNASLPLGVIGQVFNVSNNKPRPTTHNQPDSGPHVPVSTDAIVGIYEDPGIIFTTNCSATASPLHIGMFLEQRVCAGVTAVGRSGHSVTLGTTTTATGQVLKFYDISNLDGSLDEVPLSGAANQDIEVILVNHQWNNKHFRNIVGAMATSIGN